MVFQDCKIDMNNGVVAEGIPVLCIGRNLTEEYGMCVINGVVYNVVRNVLSMPKGTFYRGITWDEEMITSLNVTKEGLC